MITGYYKLSNSLNRKITRSINGLTLDVEIVLETVTNE
jgi:hypothetical protein